MKTCTKCSIPKPESEFYSKGVKENNRLMSCCKYCFNSYCMERWTQRKKDAIIYLGGKCTKCGFDGHHSALHFHHLHSKDCNWAKLRLKSNAAILKELDKCILLCANCHALEHYDKT